jgi:hypothetical protein
MVEYYDPFGEWLKSNPRDTKKKNKINSLLGVR